MDNISGRLPVHSCSTQPAGMKAVGGEAERFYLSNSTKHYLIDLTGYFDFRFSFLVLGRFN